MRHASDFCLFKMRPVYLNLIQ